MRIQHIMNSSKQFTAEHLAFDEVIKFDTVKTIYKHWLQVNRITSASDNVSSWCTRLKNKGYYFNIKTERKILTEKDTGVAITVNLINVKMPCKTHSTISTISLVHLREELYQAVNTIVPLACSSPANHIFYIQSKLFNMPKSNITITYSLPTYQELYNEDKANIRFVYDPVNRTTTEYTPIENQVYRTHIRYDNSDEIMENDDDTHNVSEPENNNQTKNIPICESKLYTDVKLGNWEIYRTTANNTALVSIKSSKSSYWIENQKQHLPKVIDTENLYHRPIYYMEKCKGYFINKNSKLYRLIAKNCAFMNGGN